LLTSWHPDTQPTEITVDTNQRWQGLNILGCTLGTQQDATGTVEFIARYKVNGRAHRLHEVSRFGRVDGRWVYINGDLAGDDPQYSMT
jgi:SEC-C motif-containing protein